MGVHKALSSKSNVYPSMARDTDEAAMPRLARIAVHPIKSLPPVERTRSTIVQNGGLEHDREYVILDEDGEYVNGKRTDMVHQIRASYDDSIETVSVRTNEETESRSFDLETEWTGFENWLSTVFGYPIQMDRNTDGGFPDDTTLHGPTVISTATIETMASWFDGIDPESMRLRLRANLEIDGVPPFWEDRLYSDPDRTVAFRVGDVTLLGANPCQRCIVPTRDPETGEQDPDFREIFVRKRRETLPSWAPEERFDHYYRVMVNTLVERADWGSELAVGDSVEILGERPLET
jgi:uncharacterized protein YcbX